MARASVVLPLLERLPGLQRLILNDVLPGMDGTQSDYDGIGEDWFESSAAMQAAFASPEGQAVGADADVFLDLTRRSSASWPRRRCPYRSSDRRTTYAVLVGLLALLASRVGMPDS
jgi:uncharacterized protein (TIGR02118 family)